MKRLIFLAILAPLLIACNKNEPDYSLDKYVVQIATVDNQANETSFFLATDDSVRLWTAASNLKYYRPKNGQRIIANYTLLSNKRDSASYDHDVKLNDVYEILTKGIFKVTPATNDSIGNDNIFIEDMWIGSHFLNVEFVYPGSNKIHFISLVSDSSKVFTDGKVHLEFRHNANSDMPSYNRWGMASFDLKSVQHPAIDSVRIVVHCNEYDKGQKSYEFTYRYKNASSAAPRNIKFPALKALVE